MAKNISDNLLLLLSDFVANHMGLYFSEERWQELIAGIEKSARDLGFEDTESWIHCLLSSAISKNVLDTLATNLTIGETFFFRDKNIFHILRNNILPELIMSKAGYSGNIKIWSAGCCSGEEPYSIAMLIDQMISFGTEVNISIIATDININFLEKAKKGIYTRWSFRDTPEMIIERYFTKQDENHFKISPHIQNMVNFYQLNLVEESYPPLINEIDVLFCRNTVMYFTPDQRDQIFRRLTRCISMNGWLIVSPSESGFVKAPSLDIVQFPEAILHRKGADKTKESDSNAPFPDRTYREKSGNEGIDDERALDKNFQNSYLEALALYKAKRYEESAENLTSILSDGKNDDCNFLFVPESMSLLAKNLGNLGKLDEAKKWIKEAIYMEKLNPGHYFILATIYQEQGHLGNSIEALKQSLYLDPEFIFVHFALGNITKRQGNLPESMKYYNNVISLLLKMAPDDIIPYSDGTTAGGFIKVVEPMINMEQSA